jgi:hypothetical protein
MGFGNYFIGYDNDSDVIKISDYIAFIYFCIEASGLFLFFIFANRKFGNRNFILILLSIFVAYFTFMALSRGKRLELLVTLLPLTLLFWSVKIPKVTTRVFVAVGFLLAFSSFASLRFGQIPTPSALFFNSFSEGLYAGHMTPGVINALDYQGLRPELGARFGIGLLATIPRFMFPGKDEIVYQSIADITEFTPLGATSLLGEIYLQGGTIFVLFAFMGLGFLARLFKVDRLYEKENKYFPLKSVYYIIFIGTFLFHFRDGIVPMIKLTLQMVILVSLFRSLLAQPILNVQRTRTAESNQ